MHRICRSLKERRSEVWISRLDLSKALTSLKTFQKCIIGVLGILGEAIRFAGSEVVATYGEKIEEWCVVSDSRPGGAGEWVVKDPDATAQDRVVRDAERLPGKTRSEEHT